MAPIIDPKVLKSERKPLLQNHKEMGEVRDGSGPIPVVEENTSEMSGKTPFDLEPADVKKDRHKSIKCILFSNFLSATGFSILLSTMWPYLREQTDPSYKKDLGYVVAAFSVGQVIGAPFWGNYCVKRPYAETMHLTIIMRLLGNMLYFFITVLPLGHAGKFHVFLASRLLTGFGAGSMAVCNAYIAGGTYLPERAHFLGLLGATGVRTLWGAHIAPKRILIRNARHVVNRYQSPMSSTFAAFVLKNVTGYLIWIE
eukprot:m.868111 g.868111  ORF g.868111 m.868111 type:complete len:256 (+) comp23556_c1_seq18:274-1041(+)